MRSAIGDRLLHRLLGDIEVTEAAVQLSDDQPGLAAYQTREDRVLGGRLRVGLAPSTGSGHRGFGSVAEAGSAVSSNWL